MLGSQELILVLIVFLFLFGPNKLSEIARSLGKAGGEFQKAQQEVKFESLQTDKNNKILNLAIEMGIDIKNKKIEEIIEEMRLKIKAGNQI